MRYGGILWWGLDFFCEHVSSLEILRFFFLDSFSFFNVCDNLGHSKATATKTTETKLWFCSRLPKQGQTELASWPSMLVVLPAICPKNWIVSHPVLQCPHFSLLPNLQFNRQLEPPPPLIFSDRILRNSALAPNFWPLTHFLARHIWAHWCTPVSVAKRQQVSRSPSIPTS